MTIDVTGIAGVRPGDIVTLIGQDGPGRIAAEQVAAWAGTISNDLLSRLGGRLQRLYVDGLGPG
jgi:alanine racemase